MPNSLWCGCIRRTGLLHSAEGYAVACRANAGSRVVGVFHQAAVIPVREPHLFGGEPELFLIEDAGVGDEAVVQVPVQALQHVG